MEKDAASRFYQASHERNLARTAGVDDAEAELIRSPNHRYFGVWRAIDKHRPNSVLELGYGGIGNVRAVASLGDFDYHVTDIVERMLGLPLPSNVKSHVCNLDQDFSFENGSFDMVVALMVVEHLYDPFHSLSEIARVLKAGGRLILNLPNIASLKCRLRLLVGQMPITSSSDWFEKREWDGNHLHYFTITDTTRLAQLFGLQLAEILPVGRHQWLKRLLPSLFCHEITYIFSKK
jgi:SAM-dependent methyltransferase